MTHSKENKYLVLDKLLRGSSNLLAEIMIIQALGVSFYGEYSIAVSAILMMTPFMLLGIEQLTSQSKELYKLKLTSLLTIGGMGGILCALFYHFTFGGAGVAPFIWIILAQLKLIHLIEFDAQRIGNFKIIFSARLLLISISILVKLYLILFMDEKIEPEVFALLYFLEITVSGLLILVLRKFFNSAEDVRQVKSRDTTKLLKLSAPLMVASFFVAVSTRLDVVALNSFFEPHSIGVYYAHLRSFEIMGQISVFIGIYLTSREFSLFGQDLKTFIASSRKHFLLAVIACASTGSIILGYIILKYFYGIEVDYKLFVVSWINLVLISTNVIMSRWQIYLGANSAHFVRSVVSFITNAVFVFAFVYALELRETTFVLLGTCLGQLFSVILAILWVKRHVYSVNSIQ